MKIETTIEHITPDIAAEYLKKNSRNRRIREATVQSFASDMAAGRWPLTHQGIAFADNDELLDGQHRLQAIILANIGVDMMVTRGIPVRVKAGGGVPLFTMDAVDRGNIRTVGDQLHIRHGYKDANAVAGAAAMVARLCCNTNTLKMTVPKTLFVLKFFGKEIVHCVQNRAKQSGISNAAVFGSVAFALRAAPVCVDEFYSAFVSGANLKKTDPAFVCREALLSSESKIRGGHYPMWRAGILLGGMQHALNGTPMRLARSGQFARDFWAGKQGPVVKAIRDLFAPIELEKNQSNEH